MKQLLLLAAAALAVAAGARGQSAAVGGAPKTIGTRGKVVSISADGARVAIHAAIEGDPDCSSGSVWQPSTGKVVRFQDAACGKKASDDQYVGLTLAGSTAAWVDYDYGNHAYCSGPYAATLAKPKPFPIDDYCDGTEDTSDVYYEFAGDGNLLVSRSALLCEADCDPDYSRTYETDVKISRLARGRLTRVLAAKDDTKLLDADAGRILLFDPAGKLLVLAPSGRQVGSVPVTKTELDRARLSGAEQVSVAKGTVLKTYDVGTGTLAETCTMKAGARLQDVESGVAVYLTAGEVHLLAIATNRDRIVARQKGLVQADLEPAGLFYAYNVPGGGSKPGRVTFVPASALPA
jgi:hypothetical protein